MYWCRVREESHQAVGVALTLHKLKSPPKLAGVLNLYGEGVFALHKFPDGNFARACPHGVRLSAYGLKLTHRCGLQIPAA